MREVRKNYLRSTKLAPTVPEKEWRKVVSTVLRINKLDPRKWTLVNISRYMGYDGTGLFNVLNGKNMPSLGKQLRLNELARLIDAGKKVEPPPKANGVIKDRRPRKPKEAVVHAPAGTHNGVMHEANGSNGASLRLGSYGYEELVAVEQRLEAERNRISLALESIQLAKDALSMN